MSSTGLSRIVEAANEDGDEEDDDDSASAFAALETITEKQVDLDTFRSEWHAELQAKKEADVATGGSSLQAAELCQQEEKNIRKKARELFLAGAAFERLGDHFSAIKNYKKAEQLVPNIERLTFKEDLEDEEQKVLEKKEKEYVVLDGEEGTELGADESVTLAETTEENLTARFMKMGIKDACSKAEQNNWTLNQWHLSDLPPELINYILKWVVSRDLDVKSLERVGLVSRGLFLATRAQEIWRMICAKTWGADNIPKCPVGCWRQYYLSRPKVQLSGLYIGRTTYYREGERGFQDQFYRSWHTVIYYRYIRFFSEGRVMMVTSPEEPANAVKLLLPKDNPGIAGTMHGSYKVVKNRVVGFVRKPGERHSLNNARHRRRRRSTLWIDIPEQEFHFEFELAGKNSKRLNWLRYEVFTLQGNGQGPSISEVDVSSSSGGSAFPSLFFSRVRSYDKESSSPLA